MWLGGACGKALRQKDQYSVRSGGLMRPQVDLLYLPPPDRRDREGTAEQTATFGARSNFRAGIGLPFAGADLWRLDQAPLNQRDLP